MSERSRDDLPPRARAYIEKVRAFRAAMDAWAAERHTMGASSAGDGFTEIRFHWETGKDRPRSEITLQADLDSSDSAFIRVTLPEEFAPRESEEGGSDVIVSGRATAAESIDPADGAVAYLRAPEERPRLEPDQRCEGCDALGTVGTAIRYDEQGAPSETHRFCDACWPEQSARYRARWEEESRILRDRQHREFHRRVIAGEGSGQSRSASHSGVSMSFGAATWHGYLELLALVQEAMSKPGRPSKRALGQIADQLFDERRHLIGEMPWDVEMFIREHTTRELPPNFPDD